MTRRPVVPREAANRDVEKIIDYYLTEGAHRAAAGLVADLQRTLDRIASHPSLGSPRYALELRIPGLGSWPLRRFPYLVFYVERDAFIDVWRVLHERRDVPARMRDSD